MAGGLMAKFLSDDEMNRLDSGKPKFLSDDEMAAHEQPQAPEEPGLLAKGLDYGIRGLDYAGGLIRTGAAAVADPFVEPDLVNRETLMNTLKGKAPSTGEYLEKSGVPEGPKVTLPIVGDVTTRGAVGLIGDIATDPLTYASFGASVPGKAGRFAKFTKPLAEGAEKVSTAVGRGTEKIGEKIFKSGLKNVDKSIKSGVPVSEVLMKEGKFGTMKGLSKDAKQIGERLNKERQAIYQKAAGQKVDMTEATQSAQEYLNKLKENPLRAGLAESLQSQLDLVKAQGFVEIPKASDWKSSIYDSLPAGAYDPNGRPSGAAKEFQKKLASDFRKAISNAAEKAEKGLGKQVDDVNEKWGSILGSIKPFEREVNKAVTKNVVTGTDPIVGGTGFLLGGAASLDPTGSALGLLALKKAADISKTTAARTTVGQGLRKLGQTGLIDVGTRRGLIRANDDE